MNSLGERSEFKLKAPPQDAISTVRFMPGINSPLLLVSSWDSTVGLYDIHSNVLKHRYTHNQRPVLDCAIKDTNYVFSGGLDQTLIAYDFRTETATNCGKHNATIRCVEYNPDRQVVLTGSWDSTVKIWDARVAINCVGTHSTFDEVYTMSVKDEMLIVGTAGRKILVWDLRNMESPLQQRDSLLKYQTRCLRIFPNKQGFVLSSIEGRVAVEYFDPSPEIQKKKYAFKCHRIKEAGMENIYPVNAISFHEDHSTFATGGSDGFVNIWDGFNKKRLCQFHRYPTGIASLSFNTTGNILAIACSHLYESEDLPNPIPEDNVFIRSVTDQETKPK